MYKDTDKPIVNIEFSRLVVIMLVVLVIGIIQIYRLFQLQIVNGEQTLENFTLKIQKERSIPSSRGNVYDRNGKLLAHNELAYNVIIEDVYESGTGKNEKLNATLLKVIRLIEKSEDKIDNDFSIVIDEDGNYAYTLTGTKLRRFKADIYGKPNPADMSDEQANATAEEMMAYLAGYSRYGVGKSSDPLNPRDSFVLGEGYTKQEILQIVTIRYAMSANSFQKYIPTVIATNVNDRTLASVLENMDTLTGISIQEDTIRVYEDSIYFSHILGYTGKISQEELETLNSETNLENSKNTQKYTLTDKVGKTGIEQTMESYLRGINGSETIYVNNMGKVVQSTDRTEPVAGNDLYLTIDADLQKATYDILEQKLAGILVAKIINSKTYKIPERPSSSTLFIPVDDVYYALINNSVININEFDDEDALPNEKAIYEKFLQKKQSIFERMKTELYEKNTPYNRLTEEYQVYQSYIVTMLTDSGVLMSGSIDKTDKTYQAWRTEEVISLGEFLRYCISQNWIDVSKIEFTGKYADSEEVVNSLTQYILEKLETNTTFSKLLSNFNISFATFMCELCGGLNTPPNIPIFFIIILLF